MKVYSVQTPVLYDRLFFLLFFNRKTLIFCHRVVSEALEHTSGSHTHTCTRAHTHMHSTLKLPKQSSAPQTTAINRDIYLYVHTPIQINTNSTVTLTRSHTHTRSQTHSGNNALQWGLQWPKAAKHLQIFPQEKKKKKKDSAHRTGWLFNCFSA